MMESMVIFHRCRSLAATDAFYIQQLGLTLWHTQPGCHIYDSGYGYLGLSLIHICAAGNVVQRQGVLR